MSDKIIKEFSGWLGDLSEQQISVLTAVRKHLHDRDIYDTRYDDWMLLRFCRVKNFKIPDIISMIDKEIHFREIHNIENTFQYDHHRCNEYTGKYINLGYSGVSKEGMPVCVEILTKLDLKAMVEQTTQKDLIMFVCQKQEILQNIVLPYCTKLAGKRIDQQITIYDLKGLDLKSVIWNKTYREHCMAASDAVLHNYPELTYQTWMINTSFAFSALWVIMKTFLPKSYVKKMRIFGSSYKKELQKIIDKDQLPDLLGGTITNWPNNTLPWSEYLDYCTTKKTQKPLRQSRASDPLKIAEFNPMIPDEIENQTKMQYHYGYSERSINYDISIEENVSINKVQTMYIMNEGEIMSAREQGRELEEKVSSKLKDTGLIVPTFSFAMEGKLIPVKKISDGEYQGNSTPNIGNPDHVSYSVDRRR